MVACPMIPTRPATEQWDAWGAPKAVVADPRDDGTWQIYDHKGKPDDR